MALTKDDLIKAIAESNGYSRDRAQELVETLLELIKTELVAGKKEVRAVCFLLFLTTHKTRLPGSGTCVV